MARRLPQPDGDAPIVVLRLGGRQSQGARIVDVLATYAERLQKAGGRLYLVGMSESAWSELLG